MAEVLVVDCGSNSGIQPVLVLLDGLQVKAVSSVEDLQQDLHGLKSARHCAIVCVTCSRADASRGLVDETRRRVGSRPVLVIDECFDGDYGHVLLERGSQDYLGAENLSSEELQRCIEWAILRNGHLATAAAIPSDHGIADGSHGASEYQQILNSLGPRARQVLELLATGLPPKQIAMKLGTSPKTVWNQLADLRLRFDVTSNHALSVLVLQLVRNEIDGE